MKFYKIWRTYSWVHSEHKCSCISDKICVIPLHETFYFNDVLQNWNRDCQSNAESLTIQLLLQPSVSGIVICLLVSGLTVDILSTFCGVFIVQCVKLMLRIFEIRVFTALLLLSCCSHQRERLHAMGVYVCSSVCRSFAKMQKNTIFSKTKQFRAMVSIDDL